MGQCNLGTHSRTTVSMILALSLLVTTLISTIGPVPHLSAAVPATGEKIVFQSDRDGDWDIYVMNTDGTGQTPLTENATLDSSPTWSPDATRIAYAGSDGTLTHSNTLASFIYVIDADGSDRTQLSPAGVVDGMPAWSPDGSRIAFTSIRTNTFDIFVMNADGSNRTRLTNGPEASNGLTTNLSPAWSPDGTKIAFFSLRIGDQSGLINMMNADGSNQTPLANSPAVTSSNFSWSPDGTRIAYSSVDGVNQDIYVMNADGSNQTRLTDHPAFESTPAWSPDGSRVLFTSNRDASADIFVMNVDGSDVIRLTNDVRSDDNAEWQPAAKVELRALEVNQSVQDWHNSIPLITNKATAVRAFVEVPDATDSKRVVGQLYGRRDGADLPGSPLLALNPGSAVMVEPDIESRRGKLAASLNFSLPLSWRSGAVKLEFKANGAPVKCQEPSGPGSNPAADCVVTVTFQDEVTPDVVFVGVRYKSGSSTIEPSIGELFEQMLRFESILPVADIDYRLETMGNYPSKPEEEKVNADLETKRLLDGFLCLVSCSDPTSYDAHYYGVLTGAGGGLANGIPGAVSSGFLSGTGAKNDTGYARNRGPHEYAHNLNRHHAIDTSLATNNDGDNVGHCNEVASTSSPGHTPFETVAGNIRPVLGSLSSGVDNEIWGLDTRFLSTDSNGLAVIDPRATFELMSYCGGGPQGRWISQFTYEGVMGDFSSTGASASNSASEDFIVVTGTIDFETGAATVGPALDVTGNLPAPATGDYRVELLDADGNVLEGTSFTPIVMDADAETPESATDQQTGLILVPLPTPASPVASIRVLQGDSPIGILEASDTAPTVSIDDPTGGEVFSDPTVTFAWSGSDADNNALVYTVLYSTDDGDTWDTLAVNTEATTLEIPHSNLAATTTARLRVIVSDGVLSTDATSARFSVNNNLPLVVIEDPADGAVFSGQQNVDLVGDAFDADDGALDGSSLSWSSDVDGALGDGAELSVSAANLTEGIHTMTLTARDSGGTSSTATVTIEIFRDAPPDQPQNAPPSVTADEATATVAEGQTATSSGNYVDENSSDDITLTASTGTISTSGTSSGSWSWSLATIDGPTQSQTVTISANDGHGGVSEATFVVVVTNVAPTVTIDSDAELVRGNSFTGAGSFTDPGADEWSGTVDYGDGGGLLPVELNPDGSFALVHTYPTGGSFTITVCVTDDDDATGCDTTGVTTGGNTERYAIFAGSDDCSSAIDWSGSKSLVSGDVHSNGGIRVGGSRNSVEGATTYRCDAHISGSKHAFTEGITMFEEVRPWPVQFTVDDFDCDITVSGKLDLSKDGPWWAGGTNSSRQLAPMTLCADEITLSGSSISGTVTLIAEQIQISGSSLRLTAHQHGVLAVATGSTQALRLSSISSQLTGNLVARNGEIKLSGSSNVVAGSIVGWTVKLSGNSLKIDVQ